MDFLNFGDAGSEVGDFAGTVAGFEDGDGPSVEDAESLGGGGLHSDAGDLKFEGIGCDCGNNPNTCGSGPFCRWQKA